MQKAQIYVNRAELYSDKWVLPETPTALVLPNPEEHKDC